jgi:TolA-binding protein
MEVKMKNRLLEQNYNSKLRSYLASGFMFRLRTFRFSSLVVCLLGSLAVAETSSGQPDPTNFLISHLAKLSQDMNTPKISMQAVRHRTDQQKQSQSSGTAPANFSTKIDQKLPLSSFITTGDSNSPGDVIRNKEFPESSLNRQLWQARISAPRDEKDEKDKNELQRLIEQIRTIKFEPKKQNPEPVIAIKPTPTTEPNEILPETEVPQEPGKKEIESKSKLPLPYEPIAEKTLQTLRNLSQHPDQQNNPFELAEILFLSGHLKEAGIFYQEALNRKDMDETVSSQDRAWILFQTGNCLRDDEPAMAKKMYRQLIAEYPDSLWADLAKAQDELINWYQQDKPRTLIAESRF